MFSDVFEFYSAECRQRCTSRSSFLLFLSKRLMMIVPPLFQFRSLQISHKFCVSYLVQRTHVLAFSNVNSLNVKFLRRIRFLSSFSERSNIRDNVTTRFLDKLCTYPVHIMYSGCFQERYARCRNFFTYVCVIIMLFHR